MNTRIIMNRPGNKGRALRANKLAAPTRSTQRWRLLQAGMALAALTLAGCSSSSDSGTSIGLDDSASQPASIITPEDALKRAILVLELGNKNLLFPLGPERQAGGWASELDGYIDAVPGGPPGATDGICDSGEFFVELEEDHGATESFVPGEVDLATLVFDRCDIDSMNAQSHQITAQSHGLGEFGVADPAEMQDLVAFEESDNFEDFETYLIRLGDQPEDRFMFDQRNHDTGSRTRMQHYARLYADADSRVGKQRLRARLEQSGQPVAQFSLNLLPAVGESAYEVVFDTGGLTNDSRGRMQVDFVGDPPPSVPVDSFECVAPGEFEFAVDENAELDQGILQSGELTITSGTVSANIETEDQFSTVFVAVDSGNGSLTDAFTEQEYADIREEVMDTCLGANL